MSSRSCPNLRDLARLGEQEPVAVATLSEALVDSRDLLELAKDCSWQDIASHVLIKQKLNHCPECNHWSVRPQYVRRHMLAKHPERAELMQKCITNIQKSNISIQNPCQYCRQQYQRRDAHLRSCIGIFNGVFLHHRLARGKPLSLAGDSVVAEGQIGTHVLRGHVRSHGKGPGGAAGSDAGPTDASIPDAHHDARRTGGAESAGGPLRQPPAEVAKVRAKGAGKRRKGEASGHTPTLRQCLERQRLGAAQASGQQAQASATGSLPSFSTTAPGPGPCGSDGEAVGRAEGYHQHVNHACAEAGSAAQHPQTGYSLRPLSQHPGPGQHGGLPLPHRGPVAQNQIRRPDQAHGARASHHVPTLDQEDTGKIPNDACHALGSIAGTGHGILETGWEDTGPSLGPSGTPTCLGRPSGGSPPGGDRGGPKVVDGPQLQGLRHQQVPRHAEADRGVPLTDGGHVPGNWDADGGCEPHVAASASTMPIRSLALGGLLSPARAYAAERPGEEIIELVERSSPRVSKAAVLSMRLGNSCNFCYANSLLRVFLHLAHALSSLNRVFGYQYTDLVQSMVRRARVQELHVWLQPEWSQFLVDWSEPSRQHDAAEFLTFLLGAGTLIRREAMELVWQARCRVNLSTVRTVDGGCSLPLILPSPGSTEDDWGRVVSVQDLVEQWRGQVTVRAALAPPTCMILQASRFHYDAEGSGARKRRYRINPTLDLVFPCFTEHELYRNVPYRLNSVVIHLGNAPHRGHYQTLFRDPIEGDFSLADDGVPARTASAALVNSLQRDMYLFVYHR